VVVRRLAGLARPRRLTFKHESRLDGKDLSTLMVLSEPRIKFAKVDQNSK